MYTTVFVGGTFDGLHRGHESVLHRAFEEAKRVVVGVTSDEFVHKFKTPSSLFQLPASYDERRKKIEEWLKVKGWVGRARIVAIDDPYEPVASSRDIEAIVVTSDNRKTGEKINKIRKEKGLSALALLEVLLVSAEDGKPISSTRMRGGEIDAEGKLVMPDSLRGELKQPLGRILQGNEITKSIDLHKDKIIVTVGDISTKTLLDHGVHPSLAIIDLFVQRKEHISVADFHFASDATIVNFKSGPGYIAQQAIDEIRVWSTQKEKRVLVIDGEEDLLVLPVLLYVPLGIIIYYGQPNEGMVEVIVSGEVREVAKKLLEKFT